MKYIFQNNRAYKVYASGKKVRVSKEKYDKYVMYKRRTQMKGGVGDPSFALKTVIIENLVKFKEDHQTPNNNNNNNNNNKNKNTLYSCFKEIFLHIQAVKPSVLKSLKVKRKIQTLNRNTRPLEETPFGKQKGKQFSKGISFYQRNILKNKKFSEEQKEHMLIEFLERICMEILKSNVADAVVSTVLPSAS